MTDQDIIAIIAQGIVDGTDLDCTAETQAREVLRQLRAAGVIVGAVKPLEWRASPWSTETVFFYDAESVFGPFGFGLDADGLAYADIPGERGFRECGTNPDDARAAAQADYEDRIRSIVEAPQCPS